MMMVVMVMKLARVTYSMSAVTTGTNIFQTFKAVVRTRFAVKLKIQVFFVLSRYVNE